MESEPIFLILMAKLLVRETQFATDDDIVCNLKMFLATFLHSIILQVIVTCKYKWACCYIQIIALLHDVSPHFLRVPAPGAEEMSHFCSVMDAGPGPV